MSAIKLKQNEGNERLAVAEGVFDFVLFKFYFLSDVSSFCFPFSKRYMKEYAQSSTGSTMVAYTATFNKLIASALPINASTEQQGAPHEFGKHQRDHTNECGNLF